MTRTFQKVLTGMALLVLLVSCDAPDDRLFGYSEGRYALLSMEHAGRLEKVVVRDGERVTEGQLLARLGTSVVQAEIAHALAKAAAALARLNDAQTGGRDQEVSAAQDRLARAKAAATNARQTYDRVKPLFDKGVVAKSRLDAAAASMQEAAASAAEAAQQLELVSLPARSDQIAALYAEYDAAKAAVSVQERRLEQMMLRAPSNGLIERVLRDAGEPAGPNAPVIRFLADGEQKAIIFVSQAKRSSISLGQEITIGCDGCDSFLRARIDRLSSEAEFTSPMIFSDQERARLTYRMEAQFLGKAPASGTPIWVQAADQ